MAQHIILGTNERDAERQKDLWLALHPAIKVLKVHRPERERHLLTRLGGRNIPRVSITVDYEAFDAVADEGSLRLSFPSLEDQGDRYTTTER